MGEKFDQNDQGAPVEVKTLIAEGLKGGEDLNSFDAAKELDEEANSHNLEIIK